MAGRRKKFVKEFSGKCERAFERPRFEWEDNIIMGLK
jgi:hypothetical protein